MAELTKYLRPEVIKRIAPLELRARTIVEGFISGRHRSPYRGFSVEFAEHREYAPGDDIRHIDWRVYAKADRFYVKQYEEETNLETHILLDASASMAYPEDPGPDRMGKYEYASCVAAALAWLLMEQQDAAGLMIFDRRIRDEVPPTSHKVRLRGLIDLIEKSRPDESTNIKAPLQYLADRLRRRGIVVLISDLLAPPDDIIAGLQRFRHHGHDVLVLQILDRDEVEFPFRDNMLFDGLEAPPRQLLADPQSLRQSYLEAMRRSVSRIRAACVDHRIDYALIATHEPLDVALSTFLAQRMHRMKR